MIHVNLDPQKVTQATKKNHIGDTLRTPTIDIFYLLAPS